MQSLPTRPNALSDVGVLADGFRIFQWLFYGRNPSVKTPTALNAIAPDLALLSDPLQSLAFPVYFAYSVRTTVPSGVFPVFRVCGFHRNSSHKPKLSPT